MESYYRLINEQKSYFATSETKNIDFRITALKNLKRAIINNESKILSALHSDLNKSEFEAYTTEIGFVLAELSYTIKSLKKWSRHVKVKTPITHFGSSSYIYSEPYGTTLIIAPWNYPFQLAIAPLIGAIAAGNCAIIKPSELTPNTSQLLEDIISGIYPGKFVAVIQGGIETNQALLREKFDYIFFTGSTQVGKIVMESAAQYLTPVTLELGGKNPCIVHNDANIPLAAKRIAWGKFINAGQTCVAPDYLYVHNDVKDEFLKQLKLEVDKQFGPEPLENNNYTRIINERHFKRLQSLLEQGQIYSGGEANSDSLKIAPTIITDLTWNDLIMKEEIFGPLLAVFEYDKITDVIEKVTIQPKPLTFSVFTEDKNLTDELLNKISFGGGCINDVVYHLASPFLPFGGVGDSGIGAYHGKSSFDTFSHKKSVLKQTTKFDLPFRYPNFKNGLKLARKFLK